MGDAKRFRFATTVGLLFALFLSACSMPNEPAGMLDKQTYIDANLQFSISYPEDWAPFLQHARKDSNPFESVQWDVKKEGLNNDFSLQVISLISTVFVPDAQPADILFDIYPNLTLTSKSVATLKVGEANKLDGYTPHKTVRAWIFRSSLRDYLLVFTAPPEFFAGHSTLFDDIANSFEILP